MDHEEEFKNIPDSFGNILSIKDQLLFYNEFILISRSIRSAGKKNKGQILPIFNLIQNLSNHAGLLGLAHSVVELLYHFFPESIDGMKPEASRLINGEAPILLESRNDEKAIVTIFGKHGNACGNNVGFGAEQVVLVRDGHARMEISRIVRKQALVLTISECKGLEFQDVLLYNFFGSSSLKNQWRVIYEFMKEQDMLDVTSPNSFPKFSQTRHGGLCSELKQLYEAITCARHRLWFCENIDELSKPMFDYWKTLRVVKVKQLDNSLAQAMRIASSPEEWKSRGIKLFWANNYWMGLLCFERTGDTRWKDEAVIASLEAAVDRSRAEKLDSTCGAESAAECFSDLGEYERAGSIKGEEEISIGDAEASDLNELVIREPFVVGARQQETKIAGCEGGEEGLKNQRLQVNKDGLLIGESWNGVLITTELAPFLKSAYLCHPETFESLSDCHVMTRRYIFLCIGRFLQIFDGLAEGEYKEPLLLEAKYLLKQVKGAGAEAGWLEERLSIAEKAFEKGQVFKGRMR